MFDGIITPIVTPFHRDEQQSINYEVTKQLIDHLIAKGVKGIFILGSNGEFHVIEEAEKIEFAEKVIGMVDHRVPVSYTHLDVYKRQSLLPLELTISVVCVTYPRSKAFRIP